MRATDRTLGASEVADAENRTRWLECVEQHNAWRDCARGLINKGFLKAPPP